MKLERCYIENFGKLSKYTYEFQDGLNIVEAENGWGKTTLAAFLKAMFFGLKYTTARKTLIDRTRYMPWNGGKFGGTLLFVQAGRRYRVERYFGKKENEDTFVLYDLETNKESEDFSKDFGEELWGIDRESYEKSAFITLNDMDLINDMISRKLGDIEEQEADMEMSSKAIALLEEEMKKLKSGRKTGSRINRIKSENLQLKEELDRCKESLNAAQQNETWLKLEKETQRLLDKQEENMDKEQEKFLQYEKKKQLESIQTEVRGAKDAYQEVHAFFKGLILTVEELQALTQNISKYDSLQTSVADHMFSTKDGMEYNHLSQLWKAYPLDEEQVAQYEEVLISMGDAKKLIQAKEIAPEERAQHKKLMEKYEGVVTNVKQIEEHLTAYSECQGAIGRKQLLEEELETLNLKRENQEHAQENHTSFGGKGILGVVFVLCGVGVAFIQIIVGIVLAVLGVLCIGLQISSNTQKRNIIKAEVHAYQKKKAKVEANLADVAMQIGEMQASYLEFLRKFHVSDDENSMQELLNIKAEYEYYQSLVERYQKSQTAVNALERELEEKQRQMKNFLSLYMEVAYVHDYREALETLRKMIGRYGELEKQQRQYQRDVQELQSKKSDIDNIVMRYYTEGPKNYHVALETIREKRVLLGEKKKQYDQVVDKYHQFERAHNVELLETIEIPEQTEAELKAYHQQQKEALLLQRRDSNEKIAGYTRDINAFQVDIDKIVDLETQMERNGEELQELEEKHALLTKAKECMVLAKENLAEKYMADMTDAFKKYLALLGTEQTDAFYMDTQLNVKIEQEGALRDADRLSRGKQDLVQVCMRMALVDAIYKEVETPILILDDPFVNLDKSSIACGVELLHKISETYQMVYFVCHSSRV